MLTDYHKNLCFKSTNIYTTGQFGPSSLRDFHILLGQVSVGYSVVMNVNILDVIICSSFFFFRSACFKRATLF